MPPFIIEADELHQFMQNGQVLLVDLSKRECYLQHHLASAIHVAPSELVIGTSPAVGKLPLIQQLEALFSRMAYTKNIHIVAYDDEGGGWAGRFLWTLDVIGHTQMSYLNGGIHAWLEANLPTTDKVDDVTPCAVSLSIDNKFIASQDDVLASLNDSDTVIWDARSPEEHIGTKAFSARPGRIPNSINLEWTSAMDSQLRIREDIADILKELGITKDKKIITHCQSHHRSGFTYMIGKSLGYDIRAYDGSWAEWGNDPNTPIETG
ncbi:MAG: sulfurtransferase [Pseudomonadales bacterium]|nr:sulfurtransferase [Pseudomonadales bacterium]